MKLTLEERIAYNELAETHNLINECESSIMKPTAYFTNCACGGIVDEEALY